MGHRGTVGVAPLIGHEEYQISGPAQPGVVHPLIEQTRLVGVGLGGYSHKDRDAHGRGKLPQAGDEGHIRLGISA